MEQVKFTKMDDVKTLEDDFIYLAVVNDDHHDCQGYQFLLYKTDEFLIWCDEISQYVEIDDWIDILEIAKLSKHGSKIGSGLV